MTYVKVIWRMKQKRSELLIWKGVKDLRETFLNTYEKDIKIYHERKLRLRKQKKNNLKELEYMEWCANSFKTDEVWLKTIQIEVEKSRNNFVFFLKMNKKNNLGK